MRHGIGYLRYIRKILSNFRHDAIFPILIFRLNREEIVLFLFSSVADADVVFEELAFI